VTYSDLVMWMWVAALLGTLVAFAAAWRGLSRTEDGLAVVRTELNGLDAIAEARTELEDATRAATGERVRLHTRATDI
jgi:hypothetical protein